MSLMIYPVLFKAGYKWKPTKSDSKSGLSTPDGTVRSNIKSFVYEIQSSIYSVGKFSPDFQILPSGNFQDSDAVRLHPRELRGVTLRPKKQKALGGCAGLEAVRLGSGRGGRCAPSCPGVGNKPWGAAAWHPGRRGRSEMRRWTD